MIYKISSYFSFLIKSNNEHGIHSPFVYNFIKNCLYKKSRSQNIFFNKIDDFRSALNSNHSSIRITDFGAGSKVFKSDIRMISAIAKNAGISKKHGKLLFKITEYFKPENILEIGTSLGIATASLSYGNPKVKIITLEGCPETAKIAKKQFKKFKLSNIETQIGEFDTTLNRISDTKKFDLIYFDGNHQKDATIKYFEKCLSFAHNDTIFIFDDIHWNKNMEQAWNTIKDNKIVSVSIDTYQWGIVFFRKEQPKEHFIVRTFIL